MNKQEQLAEIQLIRTALNKVAMNYCQTQEESKAIKDISLRLGNTETVLLAEVLSDKSNDIQVVDLGLTSGTSGLTETSEHLRPKTLATTSVLARQHHIRTTLPTNTRTSKEKFLERTETLPPLSSARNTKRLQDFK